MRSELPNVPRLRNRKLGDIRDFIFVGQTGLYPRQRGRQFSAGKTERRKISAHRRKISELEAQHFRIPTSVQSDPVVGEH